MGHRESIAFVFAHPDDEVMCTGLIGRLTKTHDVRCIAVTRGESGRRLNEAVHDVRPLDVIRHEEFKAVCTRLGVQSTMLDAGDSRSDTWREKGLEAQLTTHLLGVERIITFNAKGFNGHPDHKMISDIASQLANKLDCALWHTGYPPRNRFWWLPKRAKQKFTDTEWDELIKLSREERRRKLSLVGLYRSQFPDQKGRYYKLPKGLFKQLIRYETYHIIKE